MLDSKTIYQLTYNDAWGVESCGYFDTEELATEFYKWRASVKPGDLNGPYEVGYKIEPVTVYQNKEDIDLTLSYHFSHIYERDSKIELSFGKRKPRYSLQKGSYGFELFIDLPIKGLYDSEKVESYLKEIDETMISAVNSGRSIEGVLEIFQNKMLVVLQACKA